MALTRRRSKFAPSPSYGKPHPGMAVAKASAEFIQSIYDVAPGYIRKKVQQEINGEGTNMMLDWFYGLKSDPRPADQHFSPTENYDIPPFPWQRNGMSLYDVFG